jgi:hypothetical protein
MFSCRTAGNSEQKSSAPKNYYVISMRRKIAVVVWAYLWSIAQRGSAAQTRAPVEVDPVSGSTEQPDKT